MNSRATRAPNQSTSSTNSAAPEKPAASRQAHAHQAFAARWACRYISVMAIPWRSDLPRFGDPARVTDWLEKQLALCDDDAFARSFAAWCPVSGLNYNAYRHRKLDVDGETLLVAIRFKGGDVAQP